MENRGSNNTFENVNAMMNGDVTCLFQEDVTPEDEKIQGLMLTKEGKGTKVTVSTAMIAKISLL